MINLGNYLFNSRYIEYVKLIKNNDENKIHVHLANGSEHVFDFADLETATSAFDYIKRTMER